MNTQEIKELVAKKIAGQGTMVDVGGGLPAILNAIADALDEIAGDIPAAQIQSDWAQDDSSKVDFIKNKPTIPAAQVQSDWNQADSEEPDYIKNKPTIPQGALIVNATYNSETHMFIVSSPQSIYEAGESGRPVFLRYQESGGNTLYAQVVVVGPPGNLSVVFDHNGNKCSIGD